MNKIPIIYILSNGRSGSTLLDLVLGSSPNAWTLGEAQILPWDCVENRNPCGCGLPVQECEFWQTVSPNIPLFKGAYPIEYFRIPERTGKVIRWKLLGDLLTGRVSQHSYKAVEEYGELNAQYFKAVLEEAQKRKGSSVKWLVDPSKDPYRLFWLQQSGYFDIRVIHLTKHPQAFVYSMVKRELPEATLKVVRMAGRWLVQNTIFTRLCRANFRKDHYIHMRYEDLASQPEAVTQLIHNWLNIEFPSALSKSFRDQENHAVSGNHMRWQKTRIELDEKWKISLPNKHQQLTGVITSSLSRIYGY